ncbi:hypothetical protein NL676_021205 [Syzygium grande]|nr:hypothetical protein NL676_021205 [Syzygium grande]
MLKLVHRENFECDRRKECYTRGVVLYKEPGGTGEHIPILAICFFKVLNAVSFGGLNMEGRDEFEEGHGSATVMD